MELSPAAAYLLDRLESGGYRAWLVGGCVRDSLRGVPPNDFDIATTALPQQVMACFADLFVVPTGMRHGTVTVVSDGALLEITTLRADGRYVDGRHPDGVTFVKDIEADLARRDFTVNAMAWSSTDGLIDPFGGQRDLADRVLRCVGDPEERLWEDSLRIMRCLRFAACLGFNIDPDTAAALYACRDGLLRVAAERINHELSLLVCGQWAAEVAEEYHDILKTIIPEILPQINKSLLSGAGENLAACLALLIGGENPEMALRRLRFDTATVREVSALSALLRRPLPADREAAAGMALSASRGKMEQLCRIWRAKAAQVPPDAASELLTAVDCTRQVLECGCYGVQELSVDGETLIDLGMLPGKELGRLLAQLARAVMAGDCPNKPPMLTKLARQLYRVGKL